MHTDKTARYRQTLYIAVLAILLCLGRPAITSAHELEVNGNIAGVLHTNPDDAPVTGSATKFFIEFDDSTGKFSLPKCACTVSIIENNKIVSVKKLIVSNSYGSAGQYTFADPATYTLHFAGTPKQAGSFQPFTLNYQINVIAGKADAPPIPTGLWIGAGLGVGLILLVSYFTNRGSGKRTP